MRDNSKDLTLERNYIQKWDSSYRNTDWSRPGSIPDSALPKTSMPSTALHVRAKYYNRFLLSPSDNAFFPRKRGPNWKSRRTLPYIEQKVSANASTVPIATKYMPYSSPSSNSTLLSYAITRRQGVNRLTKPMQQSKRKIIKTRAGELGHLDSHHLSRDLLVDSKRRYYLVALIDACTRLAWAEVVGDIKSLSGCSLP